MTMRGGLRVIQTSRDKARKIEKELLKKGYVVARVERQEELKSSFLLKADVVLVVEDGAGKTKRGVFEEKERA